MIYNDIYYSIFYSINIKANVYPDENLLKGVTIVDTQLSSDLSIAKVFVSVLG